MESWDFGQQQKNTMKSTKSDLDWDQVDKLSACVTHIHRTFAEHRERCNCLEELLSKEDAEEGQLERELHNLKLSTATQAMKVLQQSATETNLQSGVSVRKEQLGDEERENLGLREELTALTEKLEAVHQSHQAYLHDIRARYKDQLLDCDTVELKKKLMHLNQEKSDLAEHLSSLRANWNTQSYKDWGSFTHSLVTLIELRENYSRECMLVTQLKHTVKMLECAMCVARDQVLLQQTSVSDSVMHGAPDSLQQKADGGSRKTCIQQKGFTATRQITSDNVQESTPDIVHRIAPKLAQSITQNMDQLSILKYAQVENTSQPSSVDETRHHVSVDSTDGLNASFQQNCQPSVSHQLRLTTSLRRLSSLKLQFPKFGEKRKSSAAITEAIGRETSSPASTVPQISCQVSLSPQPSALVTSAMASSLLTMNRKKNLQNVVQGLNSQPTKLMEEKQREIHSKKQKYEVTLPSFNSTNRPSLCSNVGCDELISNSETVTSEIHETPRIENGSVMSQKPHITVSPQKMMTSLATTLLVRPSMSEHPRPVNMPYSEVVVGSGSGGVYPAEGQVLDGTGDNRTGYGACTSNQKLTCSSVALPGLVPTYSKAHTPDQALPSSQALCLRQAIQSGQTIDSSPVLNTSQELMSNLPLTASQGSTTVSSLSHSLPNTSVFMHSEAKASEKLDSTEVESPLTSSQGFNLTDESSEDESQMFHSSQKSDVDRLPGKCSTLHGELGTTSHAESLSSDQPGWSPSSSEIYTFNSASMDDSSVAVVDKESSKIQPSLTKSKTLESVSTPFTSCFSAGTSVSATNAAESPILTSQKSCSVNESDLLYRPGKASMKGGRVRSIPASGDNSFSFIMRGETEDTRVGVSALSLFGSPDSSTAEKCESETGSVNFSLFGDLGSPKPGNSNNPFSFTFGADSETSEDTNSSNNFFSMFNSPRNTSSQEGVGFRLF